MSLDLRVLRHLLACLQADICLLPVRPVTGEATATAKLTKVIDSLHVRHLHTEHLLDRRFDLSLIRVRRDFKTKRACFVLSDNCFFRHDRTANYVVNVHTASASESFRAAAS